jgi:succinate dehydrogenase / fumarate reductase membrane anchor subunit
LKIVMAIRIFYRTALGLLAVINDYIHSPTRFVAVIAVRFGCCALATAGVVATLRIAFSG